MAGIGLLCPAGQGRSGAKGGSPGKVPDFRARDYIADRKSIKIMTRSVQLGVSAIQLALSESEGWEQTPPPRRGMFVGTTPLGGDPKDLTPALDVSTSTDGVLSMSAFAKEGYPRIHPLWLIRGLSNNILGLAAATHDFQGVNANYCSGESSGELALGEAFWAVAEGRADLCVAGASDSMVSFSETWMGKLGGEGAAFLVLRAARESDPWKVTLKNTHERLTSEVQPEEGLGYLGTAGSVVALARRLFSSKEASIRVNSKQVLSIHE